MFFILWKTAQTEHVRTLIGGTQKNPPVHSLGKAGPEISESPPAVFSLAPLPVQRVRYLCARRRAHISALTAAEPSRVSMFRSPSPSPGPLGRETRDDPGRPVTGGAPAVGKSARATVIPVFSCFPLHPRGIERVKTCGGSTSRSMEPMPPVWGSMSPRN